jgi:hypothetical protein
MIAIGGSFNMMYSLGLLIVELETARRRLLGVFELPDAKPTSELRRIFNRSKNLIVGIK